MGKYEKGPRRIVRAKLGSLAAAAILLLVVAGCQAVGRTPAPSESTPGTSARAAESGPSGVFHGALNMDGGEISAALQLIREGRRGLRGLLQAVSGLEAEGEGRLDGREFQMELVYGGECPGKMALTGEWDPETDSISGVVRATDCTGAGEGTFRFSSH